MLFKAPKLDSKEREVLGEIDALRANLAYQVSDQRRWTGLLRKDLFARAIRGSNSIEGYNVSANDSLAAAELQEPMEADEASWAAVTGYRDAMTFVLQELGDPLFTFSEMFLFGMHFMMLRHELTKNPGRYRRGAIFVRDDAANEIVYEGPDINVMPALMGELIDWLNAPSDLPVIVRAGMAHLNLTMIHPFSDGNGRMARALETAVLGRQQVIAPQFISIEEWLGRNTGAYYRVLAEVGTGSWQPRRDARPYVRFTIRAHHEQTHTLARRVSESRRLADLLEQQAASLGLPERSIVPLFNAAIGYSMRNATYRSLAEISEQTAKKDLALLVREGLLVAKGSKRGREYIASDALRAYRDRSRSRAEPIRDPFGFAS